MSEQREIIYRAAQKGLILVVLLLQSFFGMPACSWAMELPVRRYLSAQGLASREVLCMCADHSQGLWVGTPSGLSLVSAGRIRTYGPADGLPSSTIMAMVMDEKGRLWLGTDGGLAFRDSVGFHHLESEINMAGMDIRNLALGAPGEVLVCTWDNLFVCREDSVAELPVMPAFPPDEALLVMSSLGDSVLYVGTRLSGLWRVNRSTGERIHVGPAKEEHNFIYAICPFPQDEVVYLLGGRVMRTQGDTTIVIEPGEPPRIESLTNLACAPDGELWGIGRRKLWHFANDGSWVSYAVGVTERTMTSLLIDQAGSIWIGTGGEGLLQVSITSVENLKHENLISPLAMHLEGRDSVFITTDRSVLLHRRTTGALDEIPLNRDDVRLGEIWDIGRMGNDIIVIGDGGMFRITAEGKLEPLHDESSLSDLYLVRLLVRDKDSALIGTTTGVVRYAHGVWSEIPGMPEASVYALVADGDRVHVGTSGLGLWTSNGDTLWQSEFNDQLPSQGINTVLVDEERGLWIGTEAGLCLVDQKKRVRTWKKPDGLGDEMVTGLVLDGNHLWIGTDNGVQCLDLERDAFGPMLDNRVGLAGEEITTSRAFVLDEDGGLWCGFFGCVSRIDTRQLGAFVDGPEIRIEQISLDGDLWKPGRLLPHGHHVLRIRYEEQSLLWPDQAMFQYRLSEVDDTWITTHRTDDIRYSYLPRGTHCFEIAARNNLSAWGPAAAVVLHVGSPYWLRAPFLVGVTLLTFGLVTAVVKLRTRQLERKRIELEGLVRTRTTQLEEALDQVRELSLTDELTGLPNRRGFNAEVDGVVARAQRSGIPMTALAIDIDKFKVLNDTWGHAVGDAALKHFAEILRRLRRRSDLVCRSGGDEFMYVLYGAGENNGLLVAEKLRDRVESTPFADPGGETISFTVSVGVAGLDPRVHNSWQELLADADRALYCAKESGRNRVSLVVS